MEDDDLLARWEAATLGRAITHEEHVRLVLAILRQGSEAGAEDRVLLATRRNCEAQGALEKFDEALTRGWVRRIARALDARTRSADEVLRAHPELLNSRLLGLPAWRGRSGAD